MLDSYLPNARTRSAVAVLIPVITTALAGLQDTRLAVYGPQGDELAENDDFGGTLASQVTIVATDDGSHHFVVRAYSGNDSDFAVLIADARQALRRDYKLDSGDAIVVTAEDPCDTASLDAIAAKVRAFMSD